MKSVIFQVVHLIELGHWAAGNQSRATRTRPGADNPTYLKNDKPDVMYFAIGVGLATCTLLQALRGLYIMSVGTGKKSDDYTGGW
jgi:hypothetical protein